MKNVQQGRGAGGIDPGEIPLDDRDRADGISLPAANALLRAEDGCREASTGRRIGR
ncbi:MAG: hypothetical protein ABI674_10620 [Spartobacteria bacterium]